jgi:hypothetical protein
MKMCIMHGKRFLLIASILLPIAGSVLGGGSLGNGPICSGAETPDQRPDARQFENEIRPILAANCLTCHGGPKPKGDFRLDQLKPDFDDEATRERWLRVFDRVSAGEMPPKTKPRPAAKDVAAVTDWITRQAQAALAASRAGQGRVVLRRLNRAEYENTVRDLLGVDVDLKDALPLDSSANGFDNVGDALHTSSFLMEKYLEAANIALDEAIANRPRPTTISKRYVLKDQHPIRNAQEKVFRTTGNGVVLFTSSHWDAMSISDWWPEVRGRYRFRISASTIQSRTTPVTFRVWNGNGGMGGAPGHLVGYFDAPIDRPKVFEFIDHVEPHTGIAILPYGLPGAGEIDKVGADKWQGPGLELQWVEIEGPLNDVWPPKSHQQIFGDLKQVKSTTNYGDRFEVVSPNPHLDVERILRNFARRAFRRSVTDDEIKPFVALADARLAEHRSFEQAVRCGLLAIMVSPDFLFFHESAGFPTAASERASIARPRPALDDFALANRLSYFFWSTMPDEELISLAEQHELGKPETLRRQVDRMLDDPKAAAMAKNFVGQWLALRDIDATEPSQILYPEFDDMLKASMPREAELFFAEVLKHDLSLTNFIDSDFSMLNGRLAQLYGIPGVEGWEFRKVQLPANCHRGGVLTMASVLKVTANGTTTSPVLRGAWILDHILGTPPPHPPADVPAIQPDTRGATTIREQLAKHRQLASCSACHRKIDPPGFALESFDVIGGWRENYRTTGLGQELVVDGRRMSYLKGPKVDPSNEMPDGSAFANIDEFKKLLLADKHQLARALTEKLVTYATGGPSEAADRGEIEAIVERVRSKNYGLRSLVHEIVESDLFRMK